MKQELLDQQSKELCELESRLKTDIQLMNDKYKNLRDDIESELLTEMNDRDKRKNNLVLFGVLEAEVKATDPEGDDNAKIQKIFRCLGEDDAFPSVVKFFRLGRRLGNCRPIKLVFHSSEVRERVLKAGWKLSRLESDHHFRRVYIKPDLTVRQLEKDRLLRGELKLRREMGEEVVIRGGKVVPKTFFSSRSWKIYGE